MYQSTKYLIRAFVLITGIVLVLATLFLWINTYDDFVHFILQKAGKFDKTEKFKSEYLTYDKFLFIRYFSTLIFIAFTFFIYRIYHFFEEKTVDFAVFLLSKTKNEILRISKKDWQVFGLIFAISTGIKLYHFFNQPITNDEAFTFLNYVKPGFLAAASYYKLTNNHILHSLLCNIFDLLPFSPVYTLRIAAFISGLLVLFAAFIFFNKIFQTPAKFIAFTFFSFTLPVMQYGILARGYSLLLLFGIISTLILMELAHSLKNRKKLWFIYIIASTLGFYSIPVYLYIFFSQVVFFFTAVFLEKKNLKYLKEYIIAALITSGFVLILYTPVLIISGIHSLTEYDFMQALPFGEFIDDYLDFIRNYFIWISGNNLYFAIFSLIALIFALIYSFKNRKLLFIFIISFLTTPLIIVFFQRTIFFNRLLIFNTLVVAVNLGLFVEFLILRIKAGIKKQTVFLAVASVLMSILLLMSFTKLCKQEKIINLKAYHFADLIKDNSSIFSTNEVRYYTFLKFRAEYLDKKKIELFRDNFDKNFPYNYISEDKESNEQFVSKSNYRYVLIYEDEYISLYQLAGQITGRLVISNWTSGADYRLLLTVN